MDQHDQRKGETYVMLSAGCPYIDSFVYWNRYSCKEELKVCVVRGDCIGFVLALPSGNVALIRSPFAELFQALRSWQNYWVQLDSTRAQGRVLSRSNPPLRPYNSVIPHQLTFID